MQNHLKMCRIKSSMDMVDTLNIWKLYYTGQDIINYSNLKNIQVTEKESGDVFYSGYLNNLKVTSGSRGLSVKGSLNKYHNGNNFGRMARSEIKEATERLQDDLHINLTNAGVSRIDIGHNMIMDERVENYFSTLSNLPRHKRGDVKNGSLYFINSARKLIFYDKVLESKKCKETIPHLWQSKNVLRYELAINKPKAYFNMNINLGSIYREDTYNLLLQEWYNKFLNIDKMKQLRPIGNNLTPSQFRDFIIAEAIQEKGMSAMLEKVEQMKDKFGDPKNFQRAKSMIMESKFLTEDNLLADELQRKVEEAIDFYR